MSSSKQSSNSSEAELSSILFLFCALLIIVAIVLIAKIVLKSKKSGGWTSRSSPQGGGRLGLGGGPALRIPTGESLAISFGSGFAAYTAMHAAKNEVVSEGGLDWERQFFENADDDEDCLTSNIEVDRAICSKLQLK